MNKKILFNIFGFYFCWWMSVYGAAVEMYYLGPLSVLLFLFVHLYKIVYHKNEILFLIICFFVGTVIDTLLLRFNVIQYNGLLPLYYEIAPLWVVCLWVCFGATILHSFKWVKGRYLLLSVLSAISGPLIYFSAAKFNTLHFINETSYKIIIISIIWAVFIPLLILISDQLVE